MPIPVVRHACDWFPRPASPGTRCAPLVPVSHGSWPPPSRWSGTPNGPAGRSASARRRKPHLRWRASALRSASTAQGLLSTPIVSSGDQMARLRPWGPCRETTSLLVKSNRG